MRIISDKTASALCVIAVLMSTHAAAAQTRASTIAPAHAARAQQAAGPDAVFARWDKDASSALSLDEFKAGWLEVQASIALRKLHDNFVAMDANNNGSLDATEYAKLELIRKAGNSAPLLSAFDADKSLALDFKEYVGMIKSMMNNQQR